MRVALLTFLSALFAAFIIAPVQGQLQGNSITNANDISTLNFALTLEALEATFYSCYLYPLNNTAGVDCAGRGYNGFTQAQFAAAGYNASVWQAFNLIAEQELAHQSVLNITLNTLGAVSVARCIYNFGALATVTDVPSFVNLAATLETTGVSAYTGALNGITDPTLAQVAATIATVEARHSAWLNSLIGTTQPFASSGFDTYRTPQEIAAIVAPALTSANCVFNLPTTRPYGVAGIANSAATNYTGPYNRNANTGLSYTAIERSNDLRTLNYALMLEELEANFYYNASLLFNQSTFTNAGYSTNVYNYFQVIGLNENIHVATLASTITAYGGVPIQNCTYNFTTALSSFTAYLQTARVLENIGVYAYDGAANTITDTNLQRVAATIATIEARHASFLNVLLANNGSNAFGSVSNGTAGFPDILDPTLTPAQVVARVLASGLITSCANSGYDPTNANFYPTVLPVSYGIPNGTLNISSSSSTGFASSSSSSSSSGRGNGASSTASFSIAMIVVAIIASLALVL